LPRGRRRIGALGRNDGIKLEFGRSTAEPTSGAGLDSEGPASVFRTAEAAIFSSGFAAGIGGRLLWRRRFGWGGGSRRRRQMRRRSIGLAGSAAEFVERLFSLNS